MENAVKFTPENGFVRFKAHVQEKPDPQELRPQAAENRAVTASPRILLVEDNKVNQMIMSRLLRQLATDVDIAENGQEAVERVRQHTYDLVLMDCQMPVMDGYQATRAIRALPLPAGQVPIVAVTANAREEDRDRCLESGMNAFVAKPVDLATLKKQLARHLSLS